MNRFANNILKYQYVKEIKFFLDKGINIVY